MVIENSSTEIEIDSYQKVMDEVSGLMIRFGLDCNEALILSLTARLDMLAQGFSSFGKSGILGNLLGGFMNGSKPTP